MHQYAITIVALLWGALGETRGLMQSESNHDIKEESDVVKLVLTERSIDDRSLEVRYQIRNGSAQDIWVCESMDVAEPSHFEAYLADDGETFLVRRRLDVEKEIAREQPMGRYVRLRGGETRTELMAFSLPIWPRRVLSAGRVRTAPVLVNATRIVLEIGYYAGDLPVMVLDMLDEAETRLRANRDLRADNGRDVVKYTGGSRYFILRNEGIRSRNEEVIIPYTWRALKGERVLRLPISDLSVPYMEQSKNVTPPDLTPCTRIDIRFTPSALEFLFPYVDQQTLLSPAERGTLQSLKQLTITDRDCVKAIADDVKLGLDDAFVADWAMGRLSCYHKDEALLSIGVGCDASLLTQDGQVFRYPPRYYVKPPATYNIRYAGNLPSLRSITPQIHQIELRDECAVNLRDLWCRLRYHQRITAIGVPRSSAENRATYPVPSKWCDEVLKTYEKMTRAGKISPIWRCPATGKGDCAYAMNLSCRFDSPADMVLLFETKAGWNQHGGPELFTFDNHDPKGGLVLLNDGTVKFIRTEEELKQLRWK